jgi:hypothetical protein
MIDGILWTTKEVAQTTTINGRVTMNIKTVLGLTMVAVLAIATFNLSTNTSVIGAPLQQEAEDNSQNLFSYARLVVTDGGEKTTWFVGGANTNPRTESIRETYRKLGGKERPSFANLLDQIGLEGWRLLQKDGDTWIFVRGGR